MYVFVFANVFVFDNKYWRQSEGMQYQTLIQRLSFVCIFNCIQICICVWQKTLSTIQYHTLIHRLANDLHWVGGSLRDPAHHSHIWHVHSHLVCSIASVLQWTVLCAVVYTVYYCTALNTVLITGHIWHVNSYLVCCTLHILCILKTAPHTIQKCTYATSYSSLHCIYTKQWIHTVAFEFCSTLCGRSSLWEAIPY